MKSFLCLLFIAFACWCMDFITHVTFCFLAKFLNKRICKCWDCKSKCYLYCHREYSNNSFED